MNFLKCVLFFVGLLILSRLIPHPPNFTPLIAGAVFLPFLLKDKRLVIGLPISILLISDLIIGLHNTLLWTYGAFLLIGLTVFTYTKQNLKNLLSLAVVSPTIFYVLTNFGVWLTSSLYMKSFAGLVECYVLAIPFYANSLLSTILFSVLFYAVWQLVLKKGLIQQA